jgi:hypothetical protein
MKGGAEIRVLINATGNWLLIYYPAIIIVIIKINFKHPFYFSNQ